MEIHLPRNNQRKFRIFVGTQATGQYSHLYPFVSIGGDSVAPGNTIPLGISKM